MAQESIMSRKTNRPEWQEDALAAVNSLKRGEIILHATDTVWGLAADATQPKAVRRLFELKKRQPTLPLLMLASNEVMVETLLPDLPEEAWELMEISDRPVTVIAPGANHCSRYDLSPEMKSADGQYAVRLTKDPYSAFIVKGLGKPVASTSANLAGTPAPSNYGQIDPIILAGVDYVGQYQRNNKGMSQASMMVQFDNAGRFQVIRG
jgi:L-threonylcarbamoyladenylate synthase